VNRLLRQKPLLPDMHNNMIGETKQQVMALRDWPPPSHQNPGQHLFLAHYIMACGWI
jgi:hypothetical protein